MNYQKEVKAWAAGLIGREYDKGLITRIGPKWVTWLSLYEGERPRQVSTEDFYSVVVKGEGENGRSFGDLLIDEDRNRYRNDASRAAGIMGASKTAKKAAASRENGKKGGRPAAVLPAAVHLGAGYIITRTGKLQRGGYAISLSEAHRAVILSAHTAGDARTALVKAKRYWNGMKHDPELTADEARGL